MNIALDQIRKLAIDDDSRRRLMVALHDLANSLEDPSDTLQRFGYLHLQTAAIRMAFDLGLFKHLTSADKPLSTQQIAEQLGRDVAFIERFIRYLAAIGVIKQTGTGYYTASSVTKNLATTVVEAGISHCFETTGPQYQAMPAFFRKTGYHIPDAVHTVFQEAWNTPKHAFVWIGEHPENLNYFNTYMASRRSPETSWLTVYPVLEEAKDWDPEWPLYVNIGGGIGHQCAEFRTKFPNIPGRVILQDLPQSTTKALATPGVENMAHDIFEAQPIQGAKFYHTRSVMHNHPDYKVRQILERTRDAMNAKSVMLLDEIVLPETGVNQYIAAVDLTMMGAFGGMERTHAQWCKLLEDTSLKIVRVFKYHEATYESVMEVRLL